MNQTWETDPEQLFPDRVRPYVKETSFRQGSTILRQGEPAEELLVLIKGKIKIYTTSSEGMTVVLAFKTPVDLIGDVEYVQQIPLINTVEAVSDVTFLAVRHSILRELASEDPVLLQALLTSITQKFHTKSLAASVNQLYPVPVRLAAYLLSMLSAENDVLQASELPDTASLIGTTYRHINRVLKQFEQREMIGRNRKGIWIADREAVQKEAGEVTYEVMERGES
ncbi:Crp/Fnr family transcriptional regulator [Alkalicoccus urumqiensis]|uniref:Crp/Fnr family transcriptional regulator n=1 Tax=Alkalicoccus urumqiensis TaxID=1548213 RepID=A0A2P6MIZ7_ALKUR|nr:Crp/Fnr family transcriptional regulator [Alkalicoccus urumqiensis]PRO66246.1 Crp/Fnr family transcriptional regulator [Alkalicoccus urumqiensis]